MLNDNLGHSPTWADFLGAYYLPTKSNNEYQKN